MSTSTLICDPGDLLNGSRRELLGQSGFVVSGDLQRLRQALARCNKTPPPDLILFDFDAELATDPQMIAAVRQAFPMVRLVGFHARDVGEDYLKMGLRAGLDGYLLRDIRGASLIWSLLAVMSDGVILSRPIVALLRREGVDPFSLGSGNGIPEPLPECVGPAPLASLPGGDGGPSDPDQTPPDNGWPDTRSTRRLH